jgi:membrane peptidoglycan carboxypeptidase
VSPAGPGGSGPGGPGGNGPGGPGGNGPRGRAGRGGKGDPEALRKAKRRKRLNWIIAAFAVFIMLAGAGVVAFTYYSTTVVLPEQVPLPLSTAVYASDGKTQIAKLGAQNRQFVTIQQIPLYVQQEVASAEDRKFYQHSGIDYAGIARAAWNNLTGGSQQGGSTITQQYARNAYDNLKGTTYARKVREAVLASKLTSKYDKPTIMGLYLNTIFFGRGAWGIEAAAQAYFGKSASKLTVAEGAVLAALIKQPEPDPVTGHKGYDPTVNPGPAKDRWNYVLDGMVQSGWLNPADRPKTYPTSVLPLKDSCVVDCGVNTPTGNVLNYVKAEMIQAKLCTADTCSKVLASGGFKITTTIDPQMQKAAEAAAQRAKKGSVLSNQPANLMDAMAAIDPTNGRVLAYYGGDNGTGIDYAGKNTDANGVVYGGHSPGSSFKIYTLAAALAAGISTKSRWKAKPFTVPGTKIYVNNAGRQSICGDSCTLDEATIQSYNVPFYYLTSQIGPDKVVEMAKQAGVSTMWSTATNPPTPYDLTTKTGKDLAPSPFFNVVGYGQYPITVLDHANGVATFANGGKYNKAHFVLRIEQQSQSTGQWQPVYGEQLNPQGGQQRIDPQVVADVTSVLQKYPASINHTLANGRLATGKTGTWEYNGTNYNQDAWMVGYTPQLATAVWMGSSDPKKPTIIDRGGNNIGGGTLPADVWQRFMDDALKSKPQLPFPPASNIGDPTLGNGTPPPPPPPAPGQPGQLPPGCPNPFNPACAVVPGNPGGGAPAPGGGNPGGGAPAPGGGAPGGGGNPGGGGGALPPSQGPRPRY